MTSAVKIVGSGKPIESNRIQTNRDFLSIINSYQQFTRINFVKDFQQDANSTVNYKDCSDFSFLHKHFVTDLRYCSDREFEESKLLYDANDDYFPQGEEYEEEIGTDDYQLGKKIKNPSKEPSIVDDEYDNFEPTMLLFENSKYVNGGPLTRFITREGGGPRALVGIIAKLLRKCNKILHELIRKNQQAVSGRVLRLGEPDCGEDSPDEPKKNPCDPPKGPCQPAEPPGYPSKPKPKKKPFCVTQCPPKKPCKKEKC
ncbi:hypothetical protein ALC60_03374 [Trachymyrmex zeteki]|uniref:Uncharacterized protein n=1 Tax=Mycetomoellerius zeteki TaxID=64791 RepID=A0A151XAL0_9HYME|nr:hypothetical protein ALC60_03374 [Trachymyrmex zeteki]